MATIKKACKGTLYPKSSSVSRKLKSGGGFPDLNKDNKVTKKDILIGRGVLPKTAKKGMKVKKAQSGMDLIPSSKKSKKMSKPATPIKQGGKPPIGTTPPMKKGGKMKAKKCMYGCK